MDFICDLWIFAKLWCSGREIRKFSCMFRSCPLWQFLVNNMESFWENLYFNIVHYKVVYNPGKFGTIWMSFDGLKTWLFMVTWSWIFWADWCASFQNGFLSSLVIRLSWFLLIRVVHVSYLAAILLYFNSDMIWLVFNMVEVSRWGILLGNNVIKYMCASWFDSYELWIDINRW